MEERHLFNPLHWFSHILSVTPNKLINIYQSETETENIFDIYDEVYINVHSSAMNLLMYSDFASHFFFLFFGSNFQRSIHVNFNKSN